MSKTMPNRYRKMMVGAGLGALAGAGGMATFLALGGEPVLEEGRIAVGGVGVVYLMTGMFTLLGAILPGLGAKILNVGDRDELVEMRPVLTGSALSSIALGVMLLALAGSGPQGAVPDAVVIGTVGLALSTIIVFSVRVWRLYDELWRQLSWESSAYALYLLLPALLIWAVAVQLGHLPSMEPLMMIALAFGSILAGAFIAAGRRGLLAPR